ncbi:MAG: DNA polymerase III subunit gamma/tau, partial [Caldiserica bacterium]
MGYLTLYRKYRPKQFEEIKGQEHIIKTLVNSLKEKRVSHAYLFSGPRGTGKTTTARIFAKGLNCEKGITPYPCDKCKNCVSIMNGTHMDVIEIDAASNRGIDEIRNLKERVNLSPSMGRYRVFIIDEVHMLTQEAFNALLKTLEEPPPHAVFILATTDPQKVPNTILSRCIRFNFKRIGIKDLMETAREIFLKEGVEAEEDVIRKVAEASYGSLRDLLSILEQLILYSGDKINLKDLKELLGETEETWLKKCYTSMRNGDDATVLSLIGNVIDSGKEVKQILLDLINYGRKLLMAKVFGEDVEEAKYFRRTELVSIIESFMEILPELRY